MSYMSIAGEELGSTLSSLIKIINSVNTAGGISVHLLANSTCENINVIDGGGTNTHWSNYRHLSFEEIELKLSFLSSTAVNVQLMSPPKEDAKTETTRKKNRVTRKSHITSWLKLKLALADDEWRFSTSKAAFNAPHCRKSFIHRREEILCQEVTVNNEWDDILHVRFQSEITSFNFSEKIAW